MTMDNKYPISEIFGPTIQGEGPMAGRRTWFVRFAGCDYACSWCDTKYAIGPKYHGWKVEEMSAGDILAKLFELGISNGDWVTMSGGNPALFYNYHLGTVLRDAGLEIAMETQGSRLITEHASQTLSLTIVSPKPPSSGMAARTEKAIKTIQDLLTQAGKGPALKFVVFDHKDLEWVLEFHQNFPMYVPRYISAGTPSILFQGAPTEEQLKLAVCDRLRWLFESVARTPELRNFTVLPQLHVLAWGAKTGV